VVEAEAITASSPSEKDPFFAPSGDELHRRQTHARRGRDRTPRLRSARAGPAAADRPRVRCPRCGEPEPEDLSRFDPTACTALRRCPACREPFAHMTEL